MSGMILVGPKTPTETRFITFDFISNLAISETITAASIQSTVWTGHDLNPQNILSGSPVISGTTVSQMITGGVDGTIYKLVCTATTSVTISAVVYSQSPVLTTYLTVISDPLSGNPPGDYSPTQVLGIQGQQMGVVIKDSGGNVIYR